MQNAQMKKDTAKTHTFLKNILTIVSFGDTIRNCVLKSLLNKEAAATRAPTPLGEKYGNFT